VATGEPIPLEEFDAAVAGVICPAFVTCCVDVGVPLTEAQCEATLTPVASGHANADPANYSYDPAAAGACLADTQQALDTADCDTDELDESVWCQRAFTGSLQPGEACAAEVECAAQPDEDVACEETVIGEGDVCVVEYRAIEGESCYWTCTDDPSGVQFCSGAGGDRPPVQGQCFTNDGVYCEDGTCHAQGVIGDPCSGANSCGEGFCDTLAGVCSVPASAGGDCRLSSGCASGLFCQNQVCTPELEPGAPCEPTDQCRNGECESGVCVEDPPTDPNTLGLTFVCAMLSGELPTD
jgi:hypothetical protein